jgi:hypothetical protein
LTIRRVVINIAPSRIVANLRTQNLQRFFVVRGGIAQLGERLHGMQEVSGSIPLISTKFAVLIVDLSDNFGLEKQ